jgi:hypothetical protein
MAEMTVLKAAAMIYRLEGLNGIWKEVDMRVFVAPLLR